MFKRMNIYSYVHMMGLSLHTKGLALRLRHGLGTILAHVGMGTAHSLHGIEVKALILLHVLGMHAFP